ncbi:MAG: hypothetical protein NZ908_01525 [Candidatus Micrarchaeota archaeon]|nr:hypothetical protein [Candidatus Micrarchaeota archaeon]MCX8154378.1 hypothetical protein [Candidatus Micrarchaeota archaeon]
MKEIDKLVFFTGFVFVITIFLAGVAIGWGYSKMLSERTTNEINDLSSKIGLLQAVLERDDQEFCRIFNYLFPRLEESSWRLGERIEYLESQGRIDKDLKNLYLEYLYRDYLLLQTAIDRCNYTSEYIIYFYYNNATDPCEKCYYQGFEISEARSRLRDMGIKLRVYSFDGKLEGLGRYLSETYNITTYPTIIYRGKKYGYLDAGAIVRMIENELRG